jgi:hypothetical protein
MFENLSYEMDGAKAMTRPDTLFEAASYDLNKFIERRIAERRAMQRDSTDRRKQPGRQAPEQEEASSEKTVPPEPRSSH